jgi:excinuclease ABC subunit A
LALYPWLARDPGTDGSPPAPLLFSRGYHCAHCDVDFREPSAALFSFNHPLGACPNCKGFGRIITIDYDLALPDRAKSLEEGVVRPWQTSQGAECQRDLMKFCKRLKVPTKVPFHKLSRKWQEWVVQGDPDYGKDADHQWPKAWYGVRGYFRWLESKAYKMHVRVLLSRYRAYSTCLECRGRRFQPEALLYQARWACAQSSSGRGDGEGERLLTLADFYALPVREALRFVEEWSVRHALSGSDPVGVAMGEVRHRLQFLVRVGLGYLTLDRPTRSLSGGETERVNLTMCLGSHMVHTLFVLDEPSVGLHARDTGRLVEILKDLRDAGNTVVVVEHEASVMRAADQIVDLGPGQGEAGGRVVFQGEASRLMDCAESLTGQYLSGKRQAALPENRPLNRAGGRLRLRRARRNNLKNLSVDIPLNRFV